MCEEYREYKRRKGKPQTASVSDELLCKGPSRAPSPNLTPAPQPEITELLLHSAHFMDELINKCWILGERGNFQSALRYKISQLCLLVPNIIQFFALFLRQRHCWCSTDCAPFAGHSQALEKLILSTQCHGWHLGIDVYSE